MVVVEENWFIFKEKKKKEEKENESAGGLSVVSSWCRFLCHARPSPQLDYPRRQRIFREAIGFF
jgi:hypothetical protein